MEFAIDGDFENIEPAKIAETGTYKLCVTRTEVKQNRAEDGNNLEIDLMVIEDPSCEGITFTMYCALPKPGDTDKKTKRGQTYKDFKLDMLKQKVEALGGSCAGSGVVVPEDALVKATIEKRTSNENRPFNVLIEDTISPLDGGKLELS